eukprot:scaffold185337_cov16-Tisochrysis_lutea.AAC.1
MSKSRSEGGESKSGSRRASDGSSVSKGREGGEGGRQHSCPGTPRRHSTVGEPGFWRRKSRGRGWTGQDWSQHVGGEGECSSSGQEGLHDQSSGVRSPAQACGVLGTGEGSSSTGPPGAGITAAAVPIQEAALLPRVSSPPLTSGTSPPNSCGNLTAHRGPGAGAAPVRDVPEQDLGEHAGRVQGIGMEVGGGEADKEDHAANQCGQLGAPVRVQQQQQQQGQEPGQHAAGQLAPQCEGGGIAAEGHRDVMARL